MENNDFAQVPFLTREMLKFGSNARLELRISTIANIAGVVSVRGFSRSGVINLKHTTAATSVVTSSNFLVDDIPTAVSIFPATFGAGQNDIWVSLSLLINGDLVYPMVSGFISTAKGLSWPNSLLMDPKPGGSSIVLKEPADPAASANFGIAVTSGELWRILSISFRLVTSATVADRQVTIQIEPNAASFHSFWGNTVQAASLTRDYSVWQSGVMPLEAVSTKIMIPMPADLWLTQVDYLNIIVLSKQTGDQLSNVKIYLERFYIGA